MMDLNAFCALWNIKDVNVDVNRLTHRTVHQEYFELNRFAIIKNVLPEELVLQLQASWMQVVLGKTRFSSNLQYGEENYTYNFFGKYRRHFQFYWNEPVPAIIRNFPAPSLLQKCCDRP